MGRHSRPGSVHRTAFSQSESVPRASSLYVHKPQARGDGGTARTPREKFPQARGDGGIARTPRENFRHASSENRLWTDVVKQRRSAEQGVNTEHNIPLGYVGHDGCNANHVIRECLETPHWTAVESIVDSGAARSVCPLHFCDEFGTTKPTPGRDEHFKTATGARIPNEGHRVITSRADDGQVLTTSYSVADIAQPLDSVSQMCDSGATVVFEKTGGWVLSDTGNVLCTITRRNDTYVRRAWVPRVQSAPTSVSATNLPPPFGRQG